MQEEAQIDRQHFFYFQMTLLALERCNPKSVFQALLLGASAVTPSCLRAFQGSDRSSQAQF